jgi:hypothetical protein
MSFDPLQSPSKGLGVDWDSNFQNGSSLGNVRVHSLTLSYILKNMKGDSRVSLLAHTFVTPCLGHEPKVRVATHNFFTIFRPRVALIMIH